MKELNIDFIMRKKDDCDNNKMARATKTSKAGHDHNVHWALFIWIMREETKADCTDDTALKWARKIMNVFNHIATTQNMCQHRPNFELGGDSIAEEGKPLMHVEDLLTDEDTFKIIASSMEEVTKIKAMHTPEIMQACFGNEECIKLVIAKHKEAEKMKADKKSIDNKEEFQKTMNELLKGSDDEDTNTNNGSGSGEEN
jgi:hypothetical protein